MHAQHMIDLFLNNIISIIILIFNLENQSIWLLNPGCVSNTREK